jgi:hypothetical protein
VFQRSGSGFLGSALTTAAGVAGGVLAADAIRDLFSPHQAYGIGGGMAPGLGTPWAPDSPPSGYVDQGSWTTPDPGGAPAPDPGYVDQGTWDQSTPDQSGWSDQSSDPGNGGGWDTGGVDPGSDPGGDGSDGDSLI